MSDTVNCCASKQDATSFRITVFITAAYQEQLAKALNSQSAAKGKSGPVQVLGRSRSELDEIRRVRRRLSQHFVVNHKER